MSLSDRIRVIFTVEGPSWKIALAFSVGLFIGISPFLGFHTILALAIAHFFRLNKIVTLSGAYVTNPWTIAPIYTFATWVGIKVTSYEAVISKDFSFRGLSFYKLFTALKDLVVPFVAGTLFVGLVASVFAYFLTYYLIRRMREE